MTGSASAIKNSLKQARSVSDVISGSLAEVRLQIDDLKSAREDVEALLVTKEVACQRAASWAGAQIERARQKVPSPSFFMMSPDGWRERNNPTVDLGQLMLAYAGEVLIDAIQRQVMEDYDEADGISDADRQLRLAEIDRDILAAELAEEAIIRHAEAQGFNVDRRDDADPRAVLAHDSALP